jgi:hypothetical protein
MMGLLSTLATVSWRAYPAAVLVALGLAAAVWSAYRGVARAKRVRDPERALAIMQGFRISIVGLAAAAIGLAWWWQIGWLFVLALVIGGEELLESTVVILALKNDPRRPRRQLAAAAASQRAMVRSRSGGSGMA